MLASRTIHLSDQAASSTMFTFRKSEVMTITEAMLDFKGEVEKYKKINSLTNRDIAEATGYAKVTIDKFMELNDKKNSIKVAKAISRAFNIPFGVTGL